MPVINIKMTHEDGGQQKRTKDNYKGNYWTFFAKQAMEEVQKCSCDHRRSEYW